MSPSPIRDLIRSPVGIAVGLLWLVSTGYGILGPGHFVGVSILAIVLLSAFAHLYLCYRLVIAVEHIAYES